MLKVVSFPPTRSVCSDRFAAPGATKPDVAFRNFQLHRLNKCSECIGEVDADQTLGHLRHQPAPATTHCCQRKKCPFKVAFSQPSPPQSTREPAGSDAGYG